MPLEGVRVLDLSRLAPGPFCSMVLGDLGADVLLVEAPPALVSRGGVERGVEEDPREADRRRGTNALRRNKRSLVLNLRDDEGRGIFHRLCEDADVVLEGFRPGVVQRLGVDYEAVSAINPRVVYCSLSGYGQDGPYRDLVGHDINYIAVGGALGLIGRPGQKPAIPMNLLADFAGGGLMAAMAILAALFTRERTGRGQNIDVAMSDGVLYLLASAVSGVLAGGEAPRPGTAMLSGAAPHYDVYECADGKWLSLGALEPHFWANLCEVVGREDFKPLEYEQARHPEVRAHLEQFFRQKPRDAWFEELRTVDLCIAPVLGLDEALENPHHQAREMVVDVVDQQLGRFRQVGIAPKFSQTPGAVHAIGPQPGQDTEHVLGMLGYGIEEIEGLRERSVVA